MAERDWVFTSGRCRFCGCTEQEPCKTWTGDECHWIDPLRSVCSNDACAKQWAQSHKGGRAPRRRMTSVDVHKEIRRHNRKRKGL